ncbi:MAG: hypothetical protein Harvfovirus14_35 [Harvfovirus sp.]|uniref:Uncharacterized protein n=1 Tax=Harvfovirus sp. TaxID=2487768 RepID=A0A3G5A3J7_9VIRU|nr:MAG: hypothetical protein Harvfovirus14_35 [Harvfovirus sp.]
MIPNQKNNIFTPHDLLSFIRSRAKKHKPIAKEKLQSRGPYKNTAHIIGMTDPIIPYQANAVALSGDGKTLAVGAAGSGVFVFVNINGKWEQETFLEANDVGDFNNQGFSVAISFDGKYIVMGVPFYFVSPEEEVGAIVVFHLDNGIWNQTLPLVGSDYVGDAAQGYSVAISKAGNVIAVGGLADDNFKGAVWIWTRIADGNVWTQDGPKIVGIGGYESIQGISVALSSNGRILASGGNDDDNLRGAVWMFNKIGAAWIQDGPNLFCENAIGGSLQGYSVSLNGEGSLLASGAPGSLQNIGEVFIFERDNDEWSFLDKIHEPAINSAFGTSVSFNNSGNILAVGAPAIFNGDGLTAIYKRECDTFNLLQIMKEGEIGQAFGMSVSFSASGSTLAIGGPGNGFLQGETWIFQK